MNAYVILLRGINVGGKSMLSMADLKEGMKKLGFSDVATYINSGNVVLKSDVRPAEIKTKIEASLHKDFSLPIKVRVLSYKQLKAVVDNKPKGFGDEPKKYHSDAVFLIDIDADEAMTVFAPREGVDMVWPGNGVIYSQRLSALRTKSRLSKIVGTPAYKSMTIRTWGTTMKLLDLLNL